MYLKEQIQSNINSIMILFIGLPGTGSHSSLIMEMETQNGAKRTVSTSVCMDLGMIAHVKLLCCGSVKKASSVLMFRKKITNNDCIFFTIYCNTAAPNGKERKIKLLIFRRARQASSKTRLG